MSENSRPIIGIPCRYNWNTSYYELRETYPEVIYAQGGTPLMLPLIPELEYVETIIASVDAICLPGAVNDVDPLRYGREPKPARCLCWRSASAFNRSMSIAAAP